MNQVDLGGMNQYWKEGSSQTLEKKYVPLTLVGTFKQQTGIKFYTQPLAWETKGKRCLVTWFVSSQRMLCGRKNHYGSNVQKQVEKD